jgi:hypothetical protein
MELIAHGKDYCAVSDDESCAPVGIKWKSSRRRHQIKFHPRYAAPQSQHKAFSFEIVNVRLAQME